MKPLPLAVLISLIATVLFFTCIALIKPTLNRDDSVSTPLQTAQPQSSTGTTSTTNNPTTSPTSSRCIITIENQKYDVTDFRFSHPGGNIFRCGQDMTRDFFSQHNRARLMNEMSRYKVS